MRSLCPTKVKSAERVLEVLRYFNADRQEATVMDIAREMGYPQSSTSELLQCLVMLGYLHRDRFARTYRPTARVALLGAWVQPRLFRRGHLLPMLDRLAEETGHTVVLASKVVLTMQYIHVVAPRDGRPASLAEGASAHSAEANPNKATPASSARRRPTISPMRPAGTMNAPSASMYTLITHCRSGVVLFRSTAIRGSARFMAK